MWMFDDVDTPLNKKKPYKKTPEYNFSALKK